MRSGSETRKRSKLLPPVRCTESELAAVAANANDAGKTLSQYVRESLLDRPAPGPKPRRRRPTGDMVELARISGLLGKYGSNVNQLAYVANTDGDIPTGSQLNELAAQVREIQLAVRAALGRDN